MIGMSTEDPFVELHAAALGITDSLHHDKDSDYLVRVIKELAVALQLPHFDAENFGRSLFDFLRHDPVKTDLKKLCGTGRQYSLITAERDASINNNADAVLCKLDHTIPPEISDGLKSLGLCFSIEASRPSLASQWEDSPTFEHKRAP
ncbi:MAG: hypothetical protein WCD70_00770 [Alphaproteobacteria bacterium]